MVHLLAQLAVGALAVEADAGIRLIHIWNVALSTITIWVHASDVLVTIAIAFLGGAVPLSLRLVDRTHIGEIDPLGIAKMTQDIGQVARELTFVARLKVGRAQALGSIGQAVAGRRTVDEGQQLPDTAVPGGAQEPPLVGQARPIVAALRDFVGFGGPDIRCTSFRLFRTVRGWTIGDMSILKTYLLPR